MNKRDIHKIVSSLAILIPIILAISVLTPKLELGLPKISFGIDLIGGGQIILQIDKSAVEEREKAKLEALFSETHTLNQETSDSHNLVFEGTSLTTAEKDNFQHSYPQLNMNQTPMGFVITGNQALIKGKVGEALTENISILRTRLNSLGVADISIYRQGDNKIVVEIPHGNQLSRIKSILSSSAEIGFYPMAVNGITLPYKGRAITRSKEAIVTGNAIKRAIATIDQQSGLPVVSIHLDSINGKQMGAHTKINIGKPMITTITDSDYTNGIRNLSEKVVSMATINGEFSNSFIISGLGGLEESENLALILRSGAMSVPMYIVSESTIDSRLGKENATQGLMAFSIGLLALAFYVIYLYRGRGLFSIITLVVNASLIIMVLSIMGASLTLTGLAGIILTMGMAVDANIIVIEREKELIGKTATPIMDSFKSSALPILDANATTLLVAVILYNVASVSLKGFAITLALGVICTVISSYFINMYFSTTWIKEKAVKPRNDVPSVK